MKNIVFWGAKGQAKVLRELVESQGFALRAVFDINESVQPPFSDVPLIHGLRGFSRWCEDQKELEKYYALVAIGGGAGSVRLEYQEVFLKAGIAIPTVVHSSATVSASAKVGRGTQVLAGAIIGVETVVGSQCIINTGAVVDHECTLGDGVHVGPGASMAGEVKVGNHCFIGCGATVLPGVTLGESSIVGAGAVVTRTVQSHETVIGIPAHPIAKLNNQ